MTNKDDCREAFEAWFVAEGFKERGTLTETFCWQAWQAAWNTQREEWRSITEHPQWPLVAKEQWEAEQILGKALGYPWYKDDKQNFSDATEADGVCVGEHTFVTIAMEAASKLKREEWERFIEASQEMANIAKYYIFNYAEGKADEGVAKRYDEALAICERNVKG
jgi:hypothetical protein